jgi:hypothetical protein
MTRTTDFMRRVHLWVLLLYGLLAVALTWPLATQITTHVPGSDTWAYDEYTFLWNFWTFKHALIDQLSTPLHTDLIFYPVGMGLVMYTFNLLAAALALPLHLATGNIPLASNLINLASTALAGYGTFLLVLYLLHPQAVNSQQLTINGRPTPATFHLPPFTLAAAFIAGLIYAFASSRMVYLALGHYMIVTTQWLPFFLLYFVRTLDHWRSRDALIAGIFAALCLLTDMLYGVLIALMAGVLLLNWWLGYRRQRRSGQAARAIPWTRALGRLASMVAMAALLSAPLLIPTVREGLDADYAVEGWGMSDQLSADLVGLVTPTDLHPLWGGDWEETLRAVQTGESRFRDVNTVFVGYVTLALAVLGAIVAGRRARAWLAIALIAFVLALGPLLQINGQSLYDLDGLQVTVPLPYILLHYIPFVQGFRAPNRFSLVLLQALAVLVGYGAAWLLVKAAGARTKHIDTATPHASRVTLHAIRSPLAIALAVVLSAAVVFEHLAVPMPLTDARVPAPYRDLAREPEGGAVLQLPMGWRNGFGVFGAEDTRVEWYQTVHGRPILSGNTSRNPAFKFEYFERLPLLRAITGIEMYQPPDEATDQAARDQAAELMALWDVRYLTVNPPVADRYPYIDTWQATQDYALDVIPIDPQPLWDADGVQVYAVQQAAVPFPFELDLGSRNTNAYRGPGWSVDEGDIGGASGAWIDGRAAELYLPLRFETAAPVDVVLRVQPFAYPGAPQQTLSLEMNGVDLGMQPLAPGWQELRFRAPAAATRSGLNRLWLHFSHSARPIDVLPGQAMIGATGVQSPVDIEINSGGSAQDFAFITVTDPGGVTTDASAGRRGYNLATIDPKSGQVMDVRGFDTYANTFEADAMAQFIEGLSDGVIVLGAARGEAGVSLNDRAVAALASLGSAVDLRSTPGHGHAFAGVKGATPGAAAEESGPDGAYLRIAADRRDLSAAVDWVRLEAAQ